MYSEHTLQNYPTCDITTGSETRLSSSNNKSWISRVASQASWGEWSTSYVPPDATPPLKTFARGLDSAFGGSGLWSTAAALPVFKNVIKQFWILSDLDNKEVSVV